jgi:hypothetical protein
MISGASRRVMVHPADPDDLDAPEEGEPVPAVFARPDRRPTGRRPDRLRPRKRAARLDAARLVDFEGYTVESVARIVNRRPKTVYNWLTEARTYPEYQQMIRDFERRDLSRPPP